MSDIGNYIHNGPPEDEDTRPENVREGWIAIARALRTHWLVGFGQPVPAADPERGSHSRGEAFIDLIMECRYAEGIVSNGGVKMLIQPGQLVGAVSWLANRWNWTPMTVRVFLDKLQKDGMITRAAPGTHSNPEIGAEKRNMQKGKQAQIITLCNYREYQIARYVQQHAQQQASNKQTTSKQQADNNIYKEGTKEQGNQGTTPGDAGASADEIARQAYEDGLRIKQGVATQSARAAQRSTGSLDGSQGIAFAKGKLTVFNGAAIALSQDFPGINIGEVCDRAGPDVAKLNYPNADDAMAVLRKWARIVSTNKPQGPGGKPAPDAMKQLNAIVGPRR
jgi:hypothetical protein